MLEASDDAFFTKDVAGRYTFINAAGARMLGRPAAEIVGRLDRDLWPEADAVATAENDQLTLQSGGVVRYEDARGGRIWLATKGVLRDRDGKVLGLYGTARDVTGLRRAQQLETLLAGLVGHDLNGPLTVLALNTSHLSTQGLPEESVRCLEQMEAAVAQMRELCTTLLDLSRIRAGSALPVSRQPMDLGEAAEAARQTFSQLHPETAIRVERQGDLQGSWDPARVRQGISNLVENAIKHGAPGAGIRIACRGRDGEVRVEVSNQGRPISPELLPIIFEPFSRGADALSRAGSGLGLFIVREVAEAHDGRVELSSGPEGTSFSLTFPRVPAARP